MVSQESMSSAKCAGPTLSQTQDHTFLTCKLCVTKTNWFRLPVDKEKVEKAEI